MMSWFFKRIKKNDNVENIEEGVILAADGVIGFFTNISPIKSVKDLVVKIQGQLFEDKIAAFMNGAKGFTKEQEQAFIVAMDKSAEEFYKHLLSVLNQLESKSKAEICGRLYKAMLQQQVGLEEFRRLCAGIDSLYEPVITAFFRTHSPKWKKQHPDITVLSPLPDLMNKQLTNAGLLDEKARMQNTKYDGGGEIVFAYELTDVGKLLIEHGC